MADEVEGGAGKFGDWEEAAIAYWASRVHEAAQQEELRAELSAKLLAMRAKPRAGIRHPKAYVKAALANTARTWLKRFNTTRKILPLEQPTEDFGGPKPQSACEIGRDEGDFGVSLSRFWNDLDARLQRFLIVLEQKNGNLSAAAKTLRIHRNTALQWRNKIRAIVRKHALGD